MNILSSIPPVYPTVAPAANSIPSSGSSPVTPGEGFATDADDSSRGVEQSPEGRTAIRSTDQESGARANPQGLTDAELKELSELKARDREVRAHEAAHQAVGGQYAGAMSFTYQRGPDGAQYAVGGEVPIDVSPVAGDPQATIEKMRVVRAAAMAPAQPSAQDRAVAAQAMQTMLQAQSELAAGEGEREPAPGVGTARDEPAQGQSGIARQADETYRSVSAMQGAEGVFGEPTSIFA
ncbi:putative metalloprotease CJM1_0395 family protein [Marinobacter shengliensis]|uniref:putative metalloprotease CJM1_0395 family protein n=1 Tax=Marinobacter shengliensis TaxID=1389223 RepID=UPI0011094D17|nr:putative metalloprotease CJM1_0395 family protein [Marinobacter shengliensis]